jgi:KDO2-lipid IV(A) lauroyltransferase
VKKLRYALEALPVYLAYGLFRLMPLPVASWVGGKLGEFLGSFLGVRRVAHQNMALALPEKTTLELKQINKRMWNQLGRTIGEFPHLGTGSFIKRITIHGSEHVERAREAGRGVIFLSGHFANWEVAPLAAYIVDMPLHVVYRQTNNPFVEWLVRHVRGRYAAGMHRKGKAAARGVLRAIAQGEAIGMLTDQKENDGISIPFFSHEVMTGRMPAHLAKHYNATILVSRVIRQHESACFTVEIIPWQDAAKDIDNGSFLSAMNKKFEEWICEYPEQWFWLHKRWPKEVMKHAV